MTVRDIYENTIKPLGPEDRAELAGIILDDLDPDPQSAIRDREHLIELLREGFRGEPVPVTQETWERLHERIENHKSVKP
jgi:hypothetical protein